MNWTFWKRPSEVRQESSFTDSVVQLILSRATGTSLRNPNATAAVESCSGVVGRAFASAEVMGPSWAKSALTPDVLSMIGRALIREGEILFYIDSTIDGQVLLVPVSDHDITGGYDSSSWLYRLNLSGPSEMITKANIRSEAVVHLMYAQDAKNAWKGVGPIQAAAAAGRLSAETVAALADEESGPRGYLLPVPGTDGNDDSIAELKADLKTLNGTLATVESQSTSWDSGDRRTAPARDWEPRRIGARPTDSSVELLGEASRQVMAACGVSPALFDAKAAAASREAWRQLLHGTISPLGTLISAQLTKKLETPISLRWAELRASDIMGRSRAYASMIQGGLPAEKAAELAGLE